MITLEQQKIELRENEHGFLSCEVEKGIYTLDFEGTIPYRICQILSLTTFIGIIIYGIKKSKKIA